MSNTPKPMEGNILPEIKPVLELLENLRLKHWVALMEEDLRKMPPKEQYLILKNLDKWAKKEKAEKKAAAINSKIRSAKFRKLQTVDAFDFEHSKATKTIKSNYLALIQGIGSKNLPNAIFTGNAGLGKTHLARALGYVAFQKGLTTLFISAAEMVNKLSCAQKIFVKCTPVVGQI